MVSLPFDRLRVSVIRRSLMVSLPNHRLRVSGQQNASITTERNAHPLALTKSASADILQVGSVKM